MKYQILFILLLILIIFTNSYSNIINVPTDYSLIQSAISNASDGDSIIVNPGIYEESINLKGKNIFISSLYYLNQDTSLITNTIIQGNSIQSVVSIISGEDTTCVLNGFTIQNGLGIILQGDEEYTGGGISIKYESNPQIRSCVIKDNVADYGGGILVSHGSMPIIYNCVIEKNHSNLAGAGLYCIQRSDQNASNPKIISSRIFHNFSNVSGGGVEAAVNSTLEITNCLIAHNKAAHFGGGISGWFSTIKIDNCTIIQNEITNENKHGGGIGVGVVTIELRNTILWGNTAEYSPNASFAEADKTTIKYSTIDTSGQAIKFGTQGRVTILENNLYNSPLFTDSLFHISQSSLTIDAGNPASSFELEPNYNGRRINMGAYGNTEEATISNPEIGTSLTEINFDSLLIQSSDTLNLWIYNYGSTRLNLDSIYIESTEGFEIIGDSANYIAPGDSIEVLLVFTPNQTIEYSTELYIISNDENESIKTLTVTAKGYLSGQFSGLLTREFSPYYIYDDLYVEQDMTLTIEPGVRLLFDIDNSLIVDTSATLISVGTSIDSICFEPVDINNKWAGVLIFNSNTCNITYTNFEKCNYELGHSDQIFGFKKGHAIYAWNSTLNISNSTFRDCIAGGAGGALSIDSSTVALENSWFFNNRDGGFYSGVMAAYNGSNVTFTGCIFENNLSQIQDMISLSGSSVQIKNSVFKQNMAMESGVININNGSAEIINNTFVDNEFFNSYVITGNEINIITIQNNIFWNNTEPHLYFNTFSVDSFIFSYNNMDWLEEGTGNFSANPEFASLTEFTLKPYSPCIDSGDPEQFDSDSSVSDIGAEFFFHTNIEGNVSGTWDEDSSPYIIRDNVTVDYNEVLNINDKVEILFTPDKIIRVEGEFNAIGSEYFPIKFKSILDTLGNNNSFRIIANDITGYDQGNINLDWTIITNGQLNGHYGYFYVNNTVVQNTDFGFHLWYAGANISNSTLLNMDHAGIYGEIGSVNIDNCLFDSVSCGLQTKDFRVDIINSTIIGKQKELENYSVNGLEIFVDNNWGFGIDFSKGIFTNVDADIFFYEDSIGQYGEEVIQVIEDDGLLAPVLGYTSFVSRIGQNAFYIKTTEGNYVKLLLGSASNGSYDLKISYQYLKNNNRIFDSNLAFWSLESNSGILAINAPINIDNVEIKNFSGYGMDLSQIELTFSNLNIHDNYEGFAYKLFNNKEFNYAPSLDNANRIFNNIGYNFINGTNDSIDISYSYWGSTDYNELIQKINQGNGLVNITPWTDSTFSTLYDDVTSLAKSEDHHLKEFKLYQNFPNPFNPLTTINFYLPKTEEVAIEIFNSLGQKIESILNNKMTQGSHSVIINGSNFSSGIYYYKITAGHFREVKKMVILK